MINIQYNDKQTTYNTMINKHITMKNKEHITQYNNKQTHHNTMINKQHITNTMINKQHTIQ